MQKKHLDNKHQPLERLYNVSYPQFGDSQNFVKKAIPEVNHYSYKVGFNSQGWLLQKVFLEAKLTWLHIIATLN